MIIVQDDNFYILCDSIEEYGSKEEPWVSLEFPVYLNSLPEDKKDIEMIWKHAKRGTGYCTTKKSIKIINK